MIQDKKEQKTLDTERFYYCANHYLCENFPIKLDSVDDVTEKLQALQAPLVALKNFKERSND